MAQEWEDLLKKGEPLVEGKIGQIKKLSLDEKEWNFISETRDIKIYKKKVDGLAFDCVLGVTEMNASLDIVFQIASDASTRTDWDENCAEARTVHFFENAKGNLRVDYFRTKPIGLVSSRDLCFFFCWEKDPNNNSCVTSSWSVADEDTHFDEVLHKTKGAVRAHVFIGALHMTAIGEKKTLVKYFASTDPKGWLPVTLVNHASHTGAFCLASIRRVAEAHQQNPQN
eukprot:TRINITY_DN12146_c0_g1_i2.p1 TRINITY_DN12146_c0_g1~~TRINITY_DN12146_c0_g1_i2.p1  ORF type:complete len:240 (-),score=45.94 TRINITY_DN12146_c0_g1_i2:146-826(-)